MLCDRCTRFSEEISGDPLIQFVQRGNNTQVLTFPDEPFNSYFSGNTVQLCPVGALTSTSYRFKARPWDLKEFSSVCTGCSTGCSIELNTSQEKMLRILGEDNEHTNQVGDSLYDVGLKAGETAVEVANQVENTIDETEIPEIDFLKFDE